MPDFFCVPKLNLDIGGSSYSLEVGFWGDLDVSLIKKINNFRIYSILKNGRLVDNTNLDNKEIELIVSKIKSYLKNNFAFLCQVIYRELLPLILLQSRKNSNILSFP